MSETRVWLVTGASRGIGLATAKHALAAGDRVAIMARGEAVDQLAEELGDNCLALRADVSDPAQVGDVVQTLIGHWGRIDRVVNNAGYHRGGKIARLALEDWQAVLDVNLTGALNVSKACDEQLPAGAAIGRVGAGVGFRGFPGESA